MRSSLCRFCALALLVSVALLVAPSCSSVYVPAREKGSAGYSLTRSIDMSNYSAEMKHDLKVIHEAATRAFEALDIEVDSAASDKLSGHVRGKLANDDTVKVELSAIVPAGTKVQIYVGKMANKAKCVRIFEAILDELPE